MAKFPIIEYEHLTDTKVKTIYQEIQVELGFDIVPNLFKSMAINADVLEANWKKFRATVLKGDVPRTLKEMPGIAISQAHGSDYALNVHLDGLSSLGMSEEVFKTLVSNFAACPLPQREKAVISFGLKAATEAHQLTSQDYLHLYKLGLDDSEIFEIVGTADLFTSRNRYTETIALEINTL